MSKRPTTTTPSDASSPGTDTPAKESRVRVSPVPRPSISDEPFDLERDIQYARGMRILQNRYKSEGTLEGFTGFIDYMEGAA